jgi:hypothetical protein
MNVGSLFKQVQLIYRGEHQVVSPVIPISTLNSLRLIVYLLMMERYYMQ